MRVKESDRLEAVAAGLRAAGLDPQISGDDLIVGRRLRDVLHGALRHDA